MAIVLIATALLSSGFTYTIMSVQRDDRNLGYDTKLDLLDLQVKNLNSTLTSIGLNLYNINSSLSYLSSELLAIADKSNLTQEDVVRTQDNIATLTQRMHELKSQLDTVQGALENAQIQVADIARVQISHRVDLQDLQSQVVGILLDLSEMEGSIMDLQSTISELKNHIDGITSGNKIAIRISFLNFTLHGITPPPLPADYLFDVGIFILENDERQYPPVSTAKSGHSRFIRPTSLELVIRNGSDYNGNPLTIRHGDEVHVYIVAYFHVDDGVIDINPDPASGWQPVQRYKERGSALFIPYSIGTVKTESVDGRNDGYVDYCDAGLTYRIETSFD